MICLVGAISLYHELDYDNQLIKLALSLSIYTLLYMYCRRKVKAYIPMGLDILEYVISEKFPKNKSDCVSCLNYHGKVYNGNLLLCAIHPYGLKNCPDFKSSSTSLDWLEVINDIDREMQRLGWTKGKVRNYLFDNYHKKKLVLLSDEELIEFLNYLKK